MAAIVYLVILFILLSCYACCLLDVRVVNFRSVSVIHGF